MSAWIVSDFHINALITWAAAQDVRYTYGGKDYAIKGNEQGAASLLYIANVESVNHRYSEDTQSDTFKFAPVSLDGITPGVVIKSCDCFDYQACELNGYEHGIAAQITRAIVQAAVKSMPGYEAATIAPASCVATLVAWAALGGRTNGVYMYWATEHGARPRGFYVCEEETFTFANMATFWKGGSMSRARQPYNITALEVLRMVELYELHASTVAGWAGSFAQDAARRIYSTATGKLPGYSAAPWGLDETPKVKEGAE